MRHEKKKEVRNIPNHDLSDVIQIQPSREEDEKERIARYWKQYADNPMFQRALNPGKKEESGQPSDTYSRFRITENEKSYLVEGLGEKELSYNVEIRKKPLGRKTLEGHTSAAEDTEDDGGYQASSLMMFYEIISTLYDNRDVTSATTLRDFIVKDILKKVSPAFLTEICIESICNKKASTRIYDSLTQEDSPRIEGLEIDNIQNFVEPEKNKTVHPKQSSKVQLFAKIMFGTNDNSQRISEVITWFSGKPPYISTPKREDKKVLLGTMRILLSANACNFIYTLNDEENYAIGIRTILPEARR